MSGPRTAVALFGPEGQGSFNEAGLHGARQAQALGHDVTVHWVQPGDSAGRADALAAICRQGINLLVAHGGQGDAPVAAVAPQFPHLSFVITQGGHSGPNTACYEVLQEQSAFLAGVLAARASVSRVVAHLSGEKVRPGLKGRAAFAHGVRLAGPDCRFVTRFCGHQHQPDLAYETTRRLQREGADLVFAMIDGGRPGVSRACRELPIRQIGNVLDWVAREPDVFIASAVADSGRCVTEAIDDFAHGRLVPGSHRHFGLEDSRCVRLALSEPMQRAHGAALAEWQQRLLTGEVVIDTHYDGPELDGPG